MAELIENYMWTRPDPVCWSHVSCLEPQLSPHSAPYHALGGHSSSQEKQKLKILWVHVEKKIPELQMVS